MAVSGFFVISFIDSLIPLIFSFWINWSTRSFATFSATFFNSVDVQISATKSIAHKFAVVCWRLSANLKNPFASAWVAADLLGQRNDV